MPKIPTLSSPAKETPKIKPAIKPTYVKKCTCCGKEYSRPTDFYVAPSTPLYRNNSNRMTVCRGCIDTLFTMYSEKFSEADAIRRICMKFDIYYSPTLVESSREKQGSRSRMSVYIGQCNLANYAGKTYDDTIREEEDLALQSYEDLQAQSEDAEFIVTKDMIHEWGLNFSASEYEFLENEYQDWCAKCVINGKSKQTLVRDLCILKLQQNKALLDGKVDIYTKLTDTFQKTLDRADLTPKIEAANDKAAEKPLGVMIKMFEEHDPIPEPREEWKDPDGIIHFFSIYVLGHLFKMLGIKNQHAELYEREMAKYRVEMPELEDADDEDVFDAILTKISDKMDGEADAAE